MGIADGCGMIPCVSEERWPLKVVEVRAGRAVFVEVEGVVWYCHRLNEKVESNGRMGCGLSELMMNLSAERDEEVVEDGGWG